MSRHKLTPEARKAILRWSATGLGQPEIVDRLRADLGVTVDKSTVCRFLQGVRQRRATRRTDAAPVVAMAPDGAPLSDLEEDLQILRRLRTRWADLALASDVEHLTLAEQQKASAELRAVLADLRKALGVDTEPMQAAPVGEDDAARVSARLDEMATALATKEVA